MTGHQNGSRGQTPVLRIWRVSIWHSQRPGPVIDVHGRCSPAAIWDKGRSCQGERGVPGDRSNRHLECVLSQSPAIGRGSGRARIAGRCGAKAKGSDVQRSFLGVGVECNG